jgi:nucleoid DNA-binding protein
MSFKYKVPDIISKKLLWTYVAHKINHSLHTSHIISITAILFDELIKDLKLGKEINIHNFGSFRVSARAPQRYFDWFKKEVLITKGGKNLLSFTLTSKLIELIKNNLHLDKTFSDAHDKESK